MRPLLEIDVAFDARSDAPAGKDPDTWSATLLRHHQVLWGRPLPDGISFDLARVRRGVLEHRSHLGCFLLTSDTIATSHRRAKPHLYDAAGDAANAAFHRLGSTIGGSIVFPGTQIERKWTINQSRGMRAAISDRWDLTLEAIRRHYAGLESPASDALARYPSFFRAFGSFDGFVQHFMLDDMVDGGHVRFTSHFDEYRGPALPQRLEDYLAHREAQLDLVARRNAQIAAFAAGSP